MPAPETSSLSKGQRRASPHKKLCLGTSIAAADALLEIMSASFDVIGNLSVSDKLKKISEGFAETESIMVQHFKNASVLKSYFPKVLLRLSLGYTRNKKDTWIQNQKPYQYFIDWLIMLHDSKTVQLDYTVISKSMKWRVDESLVLSEPRCSSTMFQEACYAGSLPMVEHLYRVFKHRPSISVGLSGSVGVCEFLYQKKLAMTLTNGKYRRVDVFRFIHEKEPFSPSDLCFIAESSNNTDICFEACRLIDKTSFDENPSYKHDLFRIWAADPRKYCLFEKMGWSDEAFVHLLMSMTRLFNRDYTDVLKYLRSKCNSELVLDNLMAEMLE